ncbi:hypothetical protein DdX_09063 [Ditylenchus destructor]|uniref:Uncharacterized protein n=1 Tax=Ditylenchus destructor TaxID=166010 RepID=A0AAD4N4P5_9BILA|nr:hypothetical protein DdX_09063 [Ditylenchus destructor]
MVLISKNPDSNQKVLDKPEEYYRRVIRDLILTLNSRAQAYSDVQDLERDFCDDTGLNPQTVAFDFGFPTFDLLIRSSHMRKYLLIIPDDEGNAVFYPKEDPRIKHIRHHQEVANYAAGRKKELDQQDKIARAMAPAFRPQLIEGKRRIIDIAHELGAEERHITYCQIQQEYQKKYDVILNQVELRKYFKRGTPSQILITLFNDEFEFFKDSQMSGMIVLKFKIPYKDILALHEEMMNFQKDFVKHRPKPMKFVPLNYDRSFPAKQKPKRELNIKPILPSIEKNILDKIQGPDLFGELEETPEKQDDDPHSDSETNDCVEPSDTKDAVGSFHGKTHRRRYCYSSSEEDSDVDNDGDDRVKGQSGVFLIKHCPNTIFHNYEQHGCGLLPTPIWESFLHILPAIAEPAQQQTFAAGERIGGCLVGAEFAALPFMVEMRVDGLVGAPAARRSYDSQKAGVSLFGEKPSPIPWLRLSLPSTPALGKVCHGAFFSSSSKHNRLKE